MIRQFGIISEEYLFLSEKDLNFGKTIAMNSQEEYLLINQKDTLWGLCATSAGHQHINRHGVYPPPKNTLRSTLSRPRRGVF